MKNIRSAIRVLFQRQHAHLLQLIGYYYSIHIHATQEQTITRNKQSTNYNAGLVDVLSLEQEL